MKPLLLLVVVRGTGSAFAADREPADDGEDLDVEPLEVICDEVR